MSDEILTVYDENERLKEQIQQIEGQLKTKLSQWSSACKDRDKYFYKCEQLKEQIHAYEGALNTIVNTPKAWDTSFGKAYTECIRVANKVLTKYSDDTK